MNHPTPEHHGHIGPFPRGQTGLVRGLVLDWSKNKSDGQRREGDREPGRTSHRTAYPAPRAVVVDPYSGGCRLHPAGPARGIVDDRADGLDGIQTAVEHERREQGICDPAPTAKDPRDEDRPDHSAGQHEPGIPRPPSRLAPTTRAVRRGTSTSTARHDVGGASTDNGKAERSSRRVAPRRPVSTSSTKNPAGVCW